MHPNVADSLETLQSEMRACRLCIEAGHEITPGAIFTGRTGARVMVIGQAPGQTEVVARRPFNAGSGRRLFEWLGLAGWAEESFRERHYVTAVTKCYPGKNDSGRGDRVPSKHEQALCRPFLEREILLINPRLIIPVGGLAIRLFYPPRAKLSEIIGTAIYYPEESPIRHVAPGLERATQVTAFLPGKPATGRWLVPLPHPSGASQWPNRPENKALIEQAIRLLGQIRRRWKL